MPRFFLSYGWYVHRFFCYTVLRMSEIGPQDIGPEGPERERKDEGPAPEASSTDRGPEGVPDAEGEAERDRVETAEKISEAVWARPVKFVGHVISHGLVQRFRRFLKRFSDLDDDALAAKDLRETRDRARREIGEDDRP